MKLNFEERASRGGLARAANLTSDKRVEIAALAAKMRWANHVKVDKKFKPYSLSQRCFKYGITENTYKELEIKQKGCCAICGEEKPLVIDHCHVTNKIRGLLCSSCNLHLGGLGDNVESLEKAISYLKGSDQPVTVLN